MINLYFKNFNFNLSNSIGINISSEIEKEDFIKKIKELKLDYRLYSFEDLKIYSGLNLRIDSPLNFPFNCIYKFLQTKVLILEDISIKCLHDALLLNAVCDFAMNNEIIFCIKMPKGSDIGDIITSYSNYDKNYYEYLILDVFKTRSKLLTETRILVSPRYNGYTSSVADFINRIKLLGFYPAYPAENNLIFVNDKNFKINIKIIRLKENVYLKSAAISKNAITISASLSDIYFYIGELIDKIKIFLKLAPNMLKPIKYINNNPETTKAGMKEMSGIQKISLEEISSPHLVIAGAGAGKTRIIVNKFLYLLNFIPADSILVLTFTNNAVGEIKDRIASSLYLKGIKDNLINDKILNISTYHSFFYSLIKEFYKELGFDKVPLVKENNYNFGESSQDFFISYGEIVSNVLRLFKNGDIVRSIASRFRFILIDEYQDLNFFSDYIIKKIDCGRGSIMYAGDDDQAIYRFNGGDSFNILFFDLFFPSGKVFVFQNNYRSVHKIIEFSNSILNRINFRYPKKITAKKSRGLNTGSYAVSIHAFKNKIQEEKFIEKMIGTFNSQGKSTAVLIRTQKEENRYKSIFGINQNNYVGTIHKSKGLEFDIVFIANVSRGNIPHLKSIFSPGKFGEPQVALRHPFIQFLAGGDKINPFYDDEIKLFYVAASRAKEKIFISYSGEISEFLTTDF
ncbi:MAG: UvrD-helicase domain-containing protein [bacterium]